jgi:hypothetical protein
VLNDALSIYFADATLASAFVARWCIRAKVETARGVLQVREDEPEPLVVAGLHRTPWPRFGLRSPFLSQLSGSLQDAGQHDFTHHASR